MLDILQFNAPMPYKIYAKRERHVETCYRDICLHVSPSPSLPFCLSECPLSILRHSKLFEPQISF